MRSREENLQSVAESSEYGPEPNDKYSSRDPDCEGSEPVNCSKCNLTFETDSVHPTLRPGS